MKWAIAHLSDILTRFVIAVLSTKVLATLAVLVSLVRPAGVSSVTYGNF